MSYTTIKAVWPGKKHEDLQELKNSHGSAPVIWDALHKKYINSDTNWMFETDKLWPKYKDVSIPLHHRALLMMTFDRAYILKKDYAMAATHIKEFLKDFPVNPKHVNHWPAIAELFESNPDIPAIGFNMTSVSDDLFEGEWNEEKDEYDQPDWTQFYSIYDELKAKEQ